MSERGRRREIKREREREGEGGRKRKRKENERMGEEREGNDRVFDISLTSDFRLSLLEISFSGELTRASRVANEAVSNRRSAEQKYRPSSPAAKSCKENGSLVFCLKALIFHLQA